MRDDFETRFPRISSISRTDKKFQVCLKSKRQQKIADELKVILAKKDKITLAGLLAKYNVRFVLKIAHNFEIYQQWPLLVFMAEAAKPEILKMAGIAEEKVKKISEDIVRQQRNLELKRVKPVSVLTGPHPARRTDSFKKSSFQKLRLYKKPKNKIKNP